MVVITLTDCPPKIRGDITRWMLEVNTGVYVGHLSARVRDGLWMRICDNIRHGRAVMVYDTDGEQHFGFKTHNSKWMPIDYDGVMLIQHLDEKEIQGFKNGPENAYELRSNAAKNRIIKKRSGKSASAYVPPRYVVLDIETTGLDPTKDHIIKIGAVRVEDGTVTGEYSCLISQKEPIPVKITKLTGITDDMLAHSGQPLAGALEGLRAFIEDNYIVSHNSAFESVFLDVACITSQIPRFDNSYVDILALAKGRIKNVRNYKLQTLADYLKIEYETMHRALPDCITTFYLFEKLNEIRCS